ncbi:MAG: extensin family protein [Pseudomonadota bacterium]
MLRLAILLALVAGAALADLQNSLRPLLRPAPEVRETRPQARPVIEVPRMMAFAAIPDVSVLRPLVRPRALEQKAMARRRARRRGAVCGDVDLQGEGVGPVPGRIGGCGVPQAIRLKAVSGVTLSQASVMDCPTAKALKRWVEKGAKPAIGSRGGGLASLRVAAHYSCRTRNNQPGARISEHGKGRAIDISGFTLKDGSVISVEDDWGRGRNGRILRQMHRKACGPFGTVLGPEADRHHRDHFHFDTARYRSGSYCR